MRPHLKRVILFVGINVSLLAILDAIMCSQIPKSVAIKNYWLLSKTDQNYDLAFIGPSRVLNSMDCEVFERKLNCKAINLGLSGVGYAEQYVLLKLMMEENHARIKKLCVEVSYYNLINPDSSFSYPFHEYIYLPYLKKDGVFDVVKNNTKDQLKVYLWRYFPLAWFAEFNNSYLKMMFLVSNAPPGIGDMDFDEHGSVFLKSTESVNKKVAHYYSNSTMDLKTKVYLEKIIELAKRNGTEVVLYTSPVYTKKVTYSKSAWNNYRNTVNQLKRKYNLKYFDTEKANVSNDESKFYDITHLNRDGAMAFSSDLSDSLAKK